MFVENDRRLQPSLLIMLFLLRLLQLIILCRLQAGLLTDDDTDDGSLALAFAHAHRRPAIVVAAAEDRGRSRGDMMMTQQEMPDA